MYKFPARAFIGYIRICRPGSILGPQQAFLVQEQEKYFKLGDEYRAKNKIGNDLVIKLDGLSLDDKDVKYSENDKKIIEKGDTGQGNRLNKKKKKKKEKK